MTKPNYDIDKLISQTPLMNSSERAALAELGIAVGGEKLSDTFRMIHRSVIRKGFTPYNNPLSQKQIQEERQIYEARYGKKLLFLPQSHYTLKGTAVTLLTLGFNRAVNAALEVRYAAADKAGAKKALAQKEQTALAKLKKFL